MAATSAAMFSVLAISSSTTTLLSTIGGHPLRLLVAILMQMHGASPGPREDRNLQRPAVHCKTSITQTDTRQIATNQQFRARNRTCPRASIISAARVVPLFRDIGELT